MEEMIEEYGVSIVLLLIGATIIEVLEGILLLI